MLPGALPGLAGRLPLHLAGQRGVPRRGPARPLRALIRQPRSRRQRPRRNEPALQDLVTNLAHGHRLLRRPGLRPRPGDRTSSRHACAPAQPAFASLNAAFPQLRAFAREALPGVQLDPGDPRRRDAASSTRLRGLVSQDELRGLVADLRPTIPQLAKLSRPQTIPFFDQTRALSSCFNEVVIPWSRGHGRRRVDRPTPTVRPGRPRLRGDGLRPRRASPARAARATPTASTSASSAAAARTRCRSHGVPATGPPPGRPDAVPDPRRDAAASPPRRRRRSSRRRRARTRSRRTSSACRRPAARSSRPPAPDRRDPQAQDLADATNSVTEIAGGGGSKNGD